MFKLVRRKSQISTVDINEEDKTITIYFVRGGPLPVTLTIEDGNELHWMLEDCLDALKEKEPFIGPTKL